MSSITYGIIEEHYSANGHARTAYGIAVYADAEADGAATVIASVHDITSDRERLESLVAACNREGLSLVHLYDVVEDFLD